MRRFLTLAPLLAACATGPDVAEMDPGRYAFTATWTVPGFAQPATATGTLEVTAVSEDGVATYSFTLVETAGPKTWTGTAIGTAANGYIFQTATIGRAGVWYLLPHYRAGACDGNAFSVSTSSGMPMTCTWTRQ
ncbi:MAG: hypothetical protein IT352_07430 [Gemmatimonadales bacterium]|nr:hypothetical protein [Gemmatimonadales bacterium]